MKDHKWMLPLLTIAEAARETGVSYNTVKRALAHRNLFPVQEKPFTVLIPLSEVKSWYAGSTQ